MERNNRSAIRLGEGMRMREVVRFCLLVVGLFYAATSVSAGEPYAGAFERDVPVKMRDGVILRADIYRPNVDGPAKA